jgi:hypothetical protein
MLVLSIVTACAPAAPTATPIPEPTATPVEVLATKAEHLVGTWFNPASCLLRGSEGEYYRFEADGTCKSAHTLDDLHRNPHGWGRFWFEEGIYYEESNDCDPIGSYRVYLAIEEGRAAGFRFDEIDDSDPSCVVRSFCRRTSFVRVD